MSSFTTHPHLARFLSGYFHEDWGLDADGPLEVVAEFMREAGQLEAVEVAKEIHDLLAARPSEDALWNVLLEEFGCYYDPRPEWGAAGVWLQAMSEQLRSGPA